ncbi:cell division protein SepF [Candidatus Woesearchaeota archaeon]|jgi:SepF-like predicted cell division protein (DUF552 family)|nr:cell division protein SepF [Candidatus Woesearchaeota archaeon]MBT4322195.1 cell division protein SepF [Candidatus Woesearchaeota archaeon]MBT4631215.1 cell division protein SepF [Candidatus Woesearchaeota archaeon]
MKEFFSKFKSRGAGYEEEFPDEFNEDYVQLETTTSKDPKAKIVVRPFILDDFTDIKPVLDSLREGYTISLVNIKPLRERDPVELKRAINKLKKTCDAIEGDIAGFGEDWIVVTPGFAGVYRSGSRVESTSEDMVSEE